LWCCVFFIKKKEGGELFITFAALLAV